MFHFSYVKPSKEIVTKMTSKINSLRSKVEERKARLRALKAEHGITDAIYIDLLEQAREAQTKRDNNRMSYSVSNKVSTGNGMNEGSFTIGAGVVNNLLTESDFIRSEETQIARMELISRNLQDVEDDEGNKKGHRLSEDELTYLGF